MIEELKNINVKDLIPQKHTFVMVSKLHNFTQTEIEAGLYISPNNIFVDRNGIFTEAGLIEHMAQSVALHTGCDFYLKNENAPKGYIGSIKNLVISSLPKVSNEVRTKVTILQEFMGITLVNISVFLNDKEIAFGQMKTALAKVEK